MNNVKEIEIVPHVFKASLEDKEPSDLIDLAKRYYTNDKIIDLIQRRHTELVGYGIPEWKFQPAQTLTFRRIFNLISLLQTDAQDQIQNGCLKKKKDNPKDKNEPIPAHLVMVELYNDLNKAAKNLMLAAKGTPLVRLISADMASDHTADIGECLDALFQVQNVSQITELIYKSIVPEGMENS